MNIFIGNRKVYITIKIAENNEPGNNGNSIFIIILNLHIELKIVRNYNFIGCLAVIEVETNCVHFHGNTFRKGMNTSLFCPILR